MWSDKAQTPSLHLLLHPEFIRKKKLPLKWSNLTFQKHIKTFTINQQYGCIGLAQRCTSFSKWWTILFYLENPCNKRDTIPTQQVALPFCHQQLPQSSSFPLSPTHSICLLPRSLSAYLWPVRCKRFHQIASLAATGDSTEYKSVNQS